MIENLKLFGMELHWYGLFMGLAVLGVMGVTERVRKRFYGEKGLLRVEDLEKSYGWVLVFGVVGARIYHVVDYWQYYKLHLFEIGMIWNGGLGIYGAIIGGIFGLWLNGWIESVFGRKKFSSDKLFGILDVVGVGMPVGQAIGRMGNFFNQELFGKPTNLPWGIKIVLENRPIGFEKIAYYHPLFFYEALWNLIGFGVLWRLVIEEKLQKNKGNYFVIYLIWYALGRFLLESLRIRSWSVNGMPVASIVGVFIMLVGGLIVGWRKKRREWEVLAN